MSFCILGGRLGGSGGGGFLMCFIVMVRVLLLVNGCLFEIVLYLIIFSE